jgi:hypothetical protein
LAHITPRKQTRRCACADADLTYETTFGLTAGRQFGVTGNGPNHLTMPPSIDTSLETAIDGRWLR